MGRGMRNLLVLVLSPLVATVLFWACFAACVDTPLPGDPPVAKLVATWDPLACGDPHRVVVELADDSGAMISGSTECAIGGLTVDASHFGTYRGRIYSWALGEPIRSISPIEIELDQPLVRWAVMTPP